MENKQQPIISVQDRSLRIGVFKFFNSADGSENLSVNIQRSFKKKDAQDWTREDIHCYDDDLLRLANLCTRVYNAIQTYRAKNAQAKQQAPAQTQAPAPAQAPAAAPATDDEIPF